MAYGAAIPTATQITIGGTTVPILLAASNNNRRFLKVFPGTAAVDLYISPSAVLTSTSGYQVAARTVFDAPLFTGPLYGFSTAVTQVGVFSG